MQIEEKGNNIVITIEKNAKLLPSKSGKTLVIASSHGNTPTALQKDGESVVCGVNVYIPNRKYVAPPK